MVLWKQNSVGATEAIFGLKCLKNSDYYQVRELFKIGNLNIFLEKAVTSFSQSLESFLQKYDIISKRGKSSIIISPIIDPILKPFLASSFQMSRFYTFVLISYRSLINYVNAGKLWHPTQMKQSFVWRL